MSLENINILQTRRIVDRSTTQNTKKNSDYNYRSYYLYIYKKKKKSMEKSSALSAAFPLTSTGRAMSAYQDKSRLLAK